MRGWDAEFDMDALRKCSTQRKNMTRESWRQGKKRSERLPLARSMATLTTRPAAETQRDGLRRKKETTDKIEVPGANLLMELSVAANIICARKTSLADVSIIHVRALKYEGVGIASQLREEEEDEQEAGRAEASTASFITNLFHPVVEMGYCSLRASKVTTLQSPSHDWCFHFTGVHHHRDKKCKPSTPTCKTQPLVESAFREIGSQWAVEPD
ncbi:hypothetical protein EAG_03217 [Camponotus floridanus]|uniref:Uncharacterized protein n=1 Tax=Camponotus floridanus TaxID=104421 RepID=E2B239_CAMFO|nr:hypothetical protein EAG_03217 [Camponotus floridanus]